jgi:hypothetical protein
LLRGGFLLAVAGLLAGGGLVSPARGQAAGSGAVYAVSETNRFWFFKQGGQLVRLDVLTGEFALLDQNNGNWNPVVIPDRDAKSADENAQNVNFLWQNLTGANLAKLSDPARHAGRFHIISVYFNPDGSPLPAARVPQDNAEGSGATNQNFLMRLVRLDSVTGEFAVMDADHGVWVRVAIPTKAVSSDVNATDARLVGGLHL